MLFLKHLVCLVQPDVTVFVKTCAFAWRYASAPHICGQGNHKKHFVGHKNVKDFNIK